MTTFWWIFWTAIVVGALVYMSKKGWISLRGGGTFASLTAFHDILPRDKQEAIEFMMERKAGKQLEADESGQGEEPDGEKTPPVVPPEK